MKVSSGCRIITGPMMSGKTTKLMNEISILSRTCNVLLITCNIDNREDIENYIDGVSSHNILINRIPNNVKLLNLSINGLENIQTYVDLNNYDVVCIDESQFFLSLNASVRYFVNELNKFVIVCGLCGDIYQNTFGEINLLLPFCDRGFKYLKSHCQKCIDEKYVFVDSYFTSKFNGDKNQIVDIGGDSKYFPLCREHLN